MKSLSFFTHHFFYSPNICHWFLYIQWKSVGTWHFLVTKISWYMKKDNIRVSKWWQNFHLGVKYSFNTINQWPTELTHKHTPHLVQKSPALQNSPIFWNRHLCSHQSDQINRIHLSPRRPHKTTHLSCILQRRKIPHSWLLQKHGVMQLISLSVVSQVSLSIKNDMALEFSGHLV